MKPLAVYIPVFNALSNLRNIKRNILVLKKHFTEVKIYFSDNASTDGTTRFLKRIEKMYPSNIKIFVNTENVGFSKNFQNICLIEESGLVMLLGDNDFLLEAGVKQLKKILEENPELEFVMCNWAYFQKFEEIKSISTSIDVVRPFHARTLAGFLRRHRYPPVGIMQYVATKEILKKINAYSYLASPQVGAFFDAFPCNFYAPSGFALAAVRLRENDGWRSSFSSFVQTHLKTLSEIFALLEYHKIYRSLSRYLVIKIKIHYINNYIRLPFINYPNTSLKLAERAKIFFEVLRSLAATCGWSYLPLILALVIRLLARKFKFYRVVENVAFEKLRKLVAIS